MSCMYNTPTCVVIPRFPYTSLFRSLNPTGQVLDFPFVAQRHAAPGNVNRAVASVGANAVLEMFATPIRPVKACVAGVTEKFEAAFEEMIGGQLGDGAIIGLEPGQRRNQA